MTDNIEYISNYKPDTLYVNPANNGKGAYASFLSDDETIVLDMEATPRSRLCITAFYINDKEDFSTFRLIKIIRDGQEWAPDGSIRISKFHLGKMKEFVLLLSSIEFKDASKTKLSIKELDIHGLIDILNTDQGTELIKKIADNPALSEDIFALAHKKNELKVFRRLLEEFDSFSLEYIAEHNPKKIGEEDIWQHFFERNPWIFGHGLNYVFLNKEGKKLEATTTGYTHSASGNRVDALMRTKAIISQYVLIEIKKPSSSLIQNREFRSGCWPVSVELTEAVSQIQKTVFDFTCNQASKVQIKDADGTTTGEEIFKIQPKSYLVIGNLTQLKGHDEKFTCFQLYRSSLIAPEILTYDELYERAKCIVETINSTRGAIL